MVRDAGIRMIGPNCMGLLNADPGGAAQRHVLAGVSARRAASRSRRRAARLAWRFSSTRGASTSGFSTFASIGNKADVSSNDLIQYWADDPNTDVILLYLESFGNPRKFGQLAREVGRRKPIVAVKAGRSEAGARAASSHTGALAASDTIVDALFRHAGVIRTDDARGDVRRRDAARSAADSGRAARRDPHQRRRPWHSRGRCVRGAGLQVTRARTTRTVRRAAGVPARGGRTAQSRRHAGDGAPPSITRAPCACCSADPGVDSLLTIFIPPLVTAAADVAAAMTERRTRSATKPVLATFMSVEGAIPMLAPIPAIAFPKLPLRRWHARRQYGALAATDPPATIAELRYRRRQAARRFGEALARGSGWLTPLLRSACSRRIGVPVVSARAVADSLDAALAAAQAIGYPVALKGVRPDDPAQVRCRRREARDRDRRSARACLSRARDRLGSRLAGVLVQRMAGDGVEMFVGGLQDPAFGPVVFCGSGGVLVELFGDAACRLCPMSDRDAAEMLDDVRGVARLARASRQAGGRRSRVPRRVLACAALLHACPEIQEMDINPLIVRTRGRRRARRSYSRGRHRHRRARRVACVTEA